jgi:hypothetical protein
VSAKVRELGATVTKWTIGLGIATAAIALVLVPGCASRPAESIPPAAVTSAVDCLQDGQAEPEAGTVPEGFDPVEVYRCNPHATLEDAEGRWSAVEIEHLTGDLGPLLQALAEPDDAPNGNPCMAMAELVRPLWLVDALGRAVQVHYPRTSCGFTKPAVHAALDHLTVEVTRAEKVKLVEPRTADAG